MASFDFRSNVVGLAGWALLAVLGAKAEGVAGMTAGEAVEKVIRSALLPT